VHPIRSGFRAVFRQPALILAEIAWRWSFGAAAWVLIVLSVRRVLAGINLSQPEYLLARRSDLFLIADACARVLYQALPALARVAAILIPGLALIWIFAATLGRAGTLKALLSMTVILSEDAPRSERAGFAREHGASESKDPYHSGPGPAVRRRFGPLLFLNFLRAIFTLATLLASSGAVILAGVAFPGQGADPTAAALIWVLLAALVAFFWSVINWFLALAPIWIVRDGHGAFRAVADSVALFRRHSGACVAAAWWFGFLRGLALLAAFVAGVATALAVQTMRPAAAATLLIALLYFALADFLYIARLAAFVALADVSPEPLAVRFPPLAPEPQPLNTEP